MILVVANRWDAGAKAFGSRWASHDVRILTARDLSMAGWRQTLNGGDAPAAVVEGTQVRQWEITGVLTRVSCFFGEELSDVVGPDREYVAAEMTAFLWFWLSTLNCPVLNRPTPAGICEPCRKEYWIRMAAQADIPISPVCRRAILPGGSPEERVPIPATVTVVGERVFGEADPILHKQARRLAELGGIELLAVRFSGTEPNARLVSADPFPDLGDDRVAEAVLERLSCN